MAAVQPPSSLEANEKGAVFANDVDSSQVSADHNTAFEDLRDPDIGKSDAEREALVRPFSSYLPLVSH